MTFDDAFDIVKDFPKLRHLPDIKFGPLAVDGLGIQKVEHQLLPFGISAGGLFGMPVKVVDWLPAYTFKIGSMVYDLAPERHWWGVNPT